MDPNIAGWPAAPWWQPMPGNPPSLITTGPIAGIMLTRGVRHPWLDRAAEWMRAQLAAPSADWGEYELRGALAFLEHEPDAAASAWLAPRAPAGHTLAGRPGRRRRLDVRPGRPGTTPRRSSGAAC